jgi:hypothetical protein
MFILGDDGPGGIEQQRIEMCTKLIDYSQPNSGMLINALTFIKLNIQMIRKHQRISISQCARYVRQKLTKGYVINVLMLHPVCRLVYDNSCVHMHFTLIASIVGCQQTARVQCVAHLLIVICQMQRTINKRQQYLQRNYSLRYINALTTHSLRRWNCFDINM